MPNVASRLWRRGTDRAAHAAIVFGDATVSFGALAERSSRVAGGLRHDGVRPGERVALLCGSRPEFVAIEYGTFAIGATVVPLNVYYTGAELEAVLAACDVQVLVGEAELVARLDPDAFDRLSVLRRVYVLGSGAHRVPARLHADAASLLASTRCLREPRDVAGSTTALMLQTSATTGRPKGVLLSVDNLQANYDRTPAWLGLGADERILCALPLYNTFGLNQCIHATIVTGGTLVLLPRFDVRACLQAIVAHRCTFVPAVPTMVQKLLGAPEAASFDLSSIRRMLVGAAPVPAELLETVFRRIGSHVVVMTGYGLTEATALVSLDRVELRSDGTLVRPRSVGRPLEGMEMRLVDSTGADVGAGVVGEILIHGPNVMAGYYRRPSETADAFVDGWLRTGDLAVTDDHGNYYIVDRLKDLIIRGGQNVYPAEIEAALYSHPCVAEAAAIGRCDDTFGEIPEAYVALHAGRSATPEALLAHCRERLAYFKVPARIVVMDELPKGPTGKILRRALRGAG